MDFILNSASVLRKYIRMRWLFLLYFSAVVDNGNGNADTYPVTGRRHADRYPPIKRKTPATEVTSASPMEKKTKLHR